MDKSLMEQLKDDIRRCDDSQGIILTFELFNEMWDKYHEIFPDMISRHKNLEKKLTDNSDIENKMHQIQDFLEVKLLTDPSYMQSFFKTNFYAKRMDDDIPQLGFNEINEKDRLEIKENLEFVHDESNAKIKDIALFDEAKIAIKYLKNIEKKNIEDALSYIDKIKEIRSSDLKKIEKWEQLKPIVKWVCDREFEIVQAMLPLLHKFDI